MPTSNPKRGNNGFGFLDFSYAVRLTGCMLGAGIGVWLGWLRWDCMAVLSGVGWAIAVEEVLLGVGGTHQWEWDGYIMVCSAGLEEGLVQNLDGSDNCMVDLAWWNGILRLHICDSLMVELMVTIYTP